MPNQHWHIFSYEFIRIFELSVTYYNLKFPWMSEKHNNTSFINEITQRREIMCSCNDCVYLITVFFLLRLCKLKRVLISKDIYLLNVNKTLILLHNLLKSCLKFILRCPIVFMIRFHNKPVLMQLQMKMFNGLVVFIKINCWMEVDWLFISYSRKM